MKVSKIKTKILSIAVLLLFGFGLAYAQENGLEVDSQEPLKHRVVRGERPPVALEELPDDAWYPGILRVKIKPEIAKSIPSFLAIKAGHNFAITGISSIDSLNKTLRASEYKNLLHGYYTSTDKAMVYASRHAAWGFDTWFDVKLDGETDIPKAISLFMELNEVLIAEPVYKIEHIYLQDYSDIAKVSDNSGAMDRNLWIPNDPLFSGHWSYHNTGQHDGSPGKDIDLARAWNIEKGHPEVIVAVLDGGVEHWHPDLAANIWSGIGYNFVGESATIEPDPQGHGTHVAGTVAATSNNTVGVSGVAGGSGQNDGARIMTCQVFAPDYSAGGFVQAFLFATDNGAAITQNSWGYSAQGAYNQAVLDAIDYFNENGGGEVMEGGITIFASGNNNSGGQFYPAFYSGTLAVAATNNQDLRAGYSNFGHHVHLSAPGGVTSVIPERGILSTLNNGGYGFKQGTSMACPHASGVAALLVSYAHRNQISITSNELTEIMIQNTDDIYFGFNLNFVNMLGSGRLNAFKALKDLQNMQNGLINPNSFEAQATGTFDISITWQHAQPGGQVILLYSTISTDGSLIDGAEYQVGQVVQNVGEVLYIGPAEEFFHSSLNSGTLYRYRVFSFDDDFIYSTGRLATTSTYCEGFSLPVIENFDQGLVPANCWSTIDLDGDGNNWRSTLDPQDFINAAISRSHSGNTSLSPDNWLVSPPINVTAGNIILSFSVRAEDIFNWNERYSVLVSEQGNEDTGSFVEVFTSTPSSDKYEEVVVNIPGYLGKTIHIAFRHHDTHGIAALYLKNVRIEAGKPGDVNPDNDINILDAVWLVRHLNGDTPDGFIYDAADLNGDGLINEADLEILLNLIIEAQKKK